ncbi:hypothetical protein B0O99DRAFT_629207 [Bisporella sp. PMI_857]|nr:hypothetical protein B0O99DRAFT_629207 [Bisporella sp. PMI_857]
MPLLPIFYSSANPFSPKQILYPVALAAALFSMQPAAIPFDLNPRAFALSVVIIIATVYTIRLIDRHIQRCWPLLKNSIALWLKRSKGGESIGVSGDRFRDTFPPHAGIDLDTIVDEERGDASANDTRACGTRAIRGLPATGPPLQPD